jgi:uncharacterized protein YprB with RNaseH-like and TPR domain
VRKPRILFFDLETAGVNALKSDLGFILMAGYKWAHQHYAKCITISKRDLRKFDDVKVCLKLSKLFEKADIIVAHYGSVFDRRMFQGRLLINNLPPVPAVKIRDTCMIARSVANFSSNRLGHLCKILKLPNRKMDKGEGWPGWWFKAMQGDMKAVRDMQKYCIDDVLALEGLYNRIKPFDNAHPRMFHSKRESCASCGSKAIQYRGFNFTKTSKYKRYQCTACSKWGQDRKKAA